MVKEEPIPDPTDPKQQATFEQIKKYWSTVDTNHTNVELKTTTNWKLPSYAEGIFVSSGPS